MVINTDKKLTCETKESSETNYQKLKGGDWFIATPKQFPT